MPVRTRERESWRTRTEASVGDRVRVVAVGRAVVTEVESVGRVGAVPEAVAAVGKVDEDAVGVIVKAAKVAVARRTGS